MGNLTTPDNFPDPKTTPSDELFQRFDMAKSRAPWTAKQAKLIEWHDDGSATVWLRWDDGALRCEFWEERAESREWLARNGFSVPTPSAPIHAPAIF